MNEKNIPKSEEIEIELGRVFRAIRNRAWLIAAVTVLCAVLTFVATVLFITPKYEASAMFYVNNSSISVGSASVSLSSGDLTTSRNLVDSYIVILNTRETLNDVIDYAGANRSYAALKNMISAQAVDSTEIFKVTVTSEDPQEAERLANAVAYILPKRIATIIEGTSAKVVEAAVVPASASSPSYVKNTLVGFLLGLVVSIGIIALREIFDTTICTEEDINHSCRYPVLASIPDMHNPGKGNAYYGYGREKKKRSAAKAALREPVLIGGEISFAASEAYKLLRTKLQFSFVDENTSHVLAISSALSGEGKSLSAVNLAYSLSELGKKVILVDCDMRRPTLAEKLKIRKKPGLSSFLTGQTDLPSLVQPCGIAGDENAFHVITAGQNPPNPIELLSSAKMETALAALREFYDYIILDMPPVGEVSDAMAVAKYTDGMLLVVRQNHCDQNVLADTVHQFEYVNAKILGVVFNCTGEASGNGYYKKYYKKYYSKYGSRMKEPGKQGAEEVVK